MSTERPVPPTYLLEVMPDLEIIRVAPASGLSQPKHYLALAKAPNHMRRLIVWGAAEWWLVDYGPEARLMSLYLLLAEPS